MTIDIDKMTEEDRHQAILELIRKGAPSMPIDQSRGEFLLRTDLHILKRVDQAASNRDVETPLNIWITEAILAQLKKEGF